jgi:hypothetical protein
MRADVARDYDWQRPLLSRVKQVIAEKLIVEGDFEEDARHNTDLIVLTVEAKRIAVRLRRYEYATRYGGEFTIRSSRPSGAQTELAKVISGWGDYIFYGFAHPDDPFNLARWMLGNLKVFRLWHSTELANGRRPWTNQKNGDGSSGFHAYKISDLPSEFVEARYPKGT